MRARIEDIDEGGGATPEYSELSKIEDDKELLEYFKDFDGWAVGCKSEDTPNNPELFVSLDLIFDGPDESKNFFSLKDEIIRAFDSGEVRSKQSLWKERFPDESREAFRASWAEAALERPELSKRGPKSLYEM